MDGDRGPVESGATRSAEERVKEAVDEAMPAGLLTRWRTAEDRLYPMIMVIPESYERVVRLVGEVTVELQLACGDLAALVDEAPRVADRVRRLAAEAGLGDGLDFELISGAACLMRYRQREAEMRRQQRIRHILAAAAGGANWVVLEEGAPPTTWPPMPSTTLEMHLPSGRALEQTISMDEATGAPIFRLAVLALDPSTGERPPGQGGSGEVAEEYSDLAEWRSATALRRREIELGH